MRIETIIVLLALIIFLAWAIPDVIDIFKGIRLFNKYHKEKVKKENKKKSSFWSFLQDWAQTGSKKQRKRKVLFLLTIVIAISLLGFMAYLAIKKSNDKLKK